MKMETGDRDFKYFMQDVSKVYIGARYSYGEMMEIEHLPFKLKAILGHYILKDVAADTTPENHIFYMRDTDLSYMVYRQLRAGFQLSFPYLNKKGTWQYKSEYHTIDEIVHNEAWKAQMDTIVVEEVVIAKLQIMMMSL